MEPCVSAPNPEAVEPCVPAPNFQDGGALHYDLLSDQNLQNRRASAIHERAREAEGEELDASNFARAFVYLANPLMRLFTTINLLRRHVPIRDISYKDSD